MKIYYIKIVKLLKNKINDLNPFMKELLKLRIYLFQLNTLKINVNFFEKDKLIITKPFTINLKKEAV